MLWKVISSAALLITCSACAAPLPEHDPSKAWIDVRSQAGHRLSAQRIDGDKVNEKEVIYIEELDEPPKTISIGSGVTAE